LILYLDTSALVKLYDEEEGTEVVERAVEEAELVAPSVVAYSEARAALARKRREGVFSDEEHREAVEALDEDWETFEKPEVTEDLAREAGDLAERHALRGFDALHLASALLARDAWSWQGEEDTRKPVSFLGFDAKLTKAAGEVMQVYEPVEGPDDPGTEPGQVVEEPALGEAALRDAVRTNSFVQRSRCSAADRGGASRSRPPSVAIRTTGSSLPGAGGMPGSRRGRRSTYRNIEGSRFCTTVQRSSGRSAIRACSKTDSALGASYSQ
jgi:predicted nucleic acid-binding protein